MLRLTGIRCDRHPHYEMTLYTIEELTPTGDRWINDGYRCTRWGCRRFFQAEYGYCTWEEGKSRSDLPKESPKCYAHFSDPFFLFVAQVGENAYEYRCPHSGCDEHREFEVESALDAKPAPPKGE